MIQTEFVFPFVKLDDGIYSYQGSFEAQVYVKEFGKLQTTLGGVHHYHVRHSSIARIQKFNLYPQGAYNGI